MNPMSESEQLELRQSSNWFMRAQMEKLQKEFHLDAFGQYAWHPWRGELVFSSGGVPKIVARIQVAGSLSTRNQSWTWAWAKSDLLPPVQQAALQVRRFGEERAVLSLIQPRWAAKEADAWQMTAIACKLIGAQGAFKCPAQDGATFLVLDGVRDVSDRKRLFGARTCAHVLEEDRPILLVSRETDGEVLAVCGGEDDADGTMRELSLDQLLNLDPDLAALADLPDGWAALRESPGHAWTRSQAE
jgi:hypothetical protein